MTVESILVILLIGAVSGWLASVLVRGGGLGLGGNIAVGVLGAFLGGWLLPEVGLRIGDGLGGSILTAFIGAVVILLLLSLFRRGTAAAR